MAYCDWLSQQTGRAYRLPSEAEWEYACRAETATPFHFGATITTDHANYDGNHPYGAGAKCEFREHTVPVGSLPPTPWGLYEVHGNVWEWTAYCSHADYSDAPTDGSAWSDAGCRANRVVRGGCCFNPAQRCRSAHLARRIPAVRYKYVGFRCARVQGP